MALEVEDGTGKSNAESYISVADADDYHTKRGNTAWTGADSVKEAVLRKATDFMLQEFATRWKGSRVHERQALDWPRWNVSRPDISPYWYVDSDVVPVEVQRACAELALRALAGDLNPDIAAQEVASEAVGPISTSYFQSGSRKTRYEAAERLLDPFLKAAGGVALVRG